MFWVVSHLLKVPEGDDIGGWMNYIEVCGR